MVWSTAHRIFFCCKNVAARRAGCAPGHAEAVRQERRGVLRGVGVRRAADTWLAGLRILRAVRPCAAGGALPLGGVDVRAVARRARHAEVDVAVLFDRRVVPPSARQADAPRYRVRGEGERLGVRRAPARRKGSRARLSGPSDVADEAQEHAFLLAGAAAGRRHRGSHFEQGSRGAAKSSRKLSTGQGTHFPTAPVMLPK